MAQRLPRGGRGKTPMSTETPVAEFIRWMQTALAPDHAPAELARRLALKTDGRYILLDAATVDWIESAGNYICVHVGADTYIVREPLARFTERLDPLQFRRIHRTAVVNVARVQELRPAFSGDYIVVLTDGTERILSRRYRDQFMADVTVGL